MQMPLTSLQVRSNLTYIERPIFLFDVSDKSYKNGPYFSKFHSDVTQIGVK